MRMAYLAKETAGERLELSMTGQRGAMVMQMVVPGYPYEMTQIKEMVMQRGTEAPMRMPESMLSMMRSRMPNASQVNEASCGRMTEVGKERITVPAGTYQTTHYRDSTGGTDVWVPITYYPNTAGLTRKDHSMTVVGRLRPEVTVAGAESEMRAIAARVAERYPAENGGTGAHVESLHALLVGDVRAPLYIVMGAVALLLLIACANVANLQLSHAVARRREMSVRAALGAGRQRLARQLLTESVILSVIGGVLGLVVAYGGVAVLVKIIPIDLTFFSPIGVDARVMALRR
jgi:hypothetical protein